MKLNTSNVFRIFIAAALVIGMTSCGGNQQQGSDESQKEVTILYPNWAEGIAFTHLAQVALENQDYDVTLTNLEPGIIYGELSKDDAKGDVFLDAWLPNTHKDYWADYGDKLVKLGESFSGGTTGLVVPTYVPINSIEELNENKEKFNGEIIGIGGGAGIHANTIKAIEAYDLDFEQITSSGPAMVASLEKAINDQEWVVVTGWKPHFMWASHDLKYLEDPKGIYPKDVCAIVARSDFEEDSPDAAAFFKNFNLTEEQLYGLMAKIRETDEATGAQQWYNENKALVDGWFE